MANKQVSPMIKGLLEYGPVVIFFATYVLFKDSVLTLGGQEYTGFVLATMVFVPLLIATTFIGWLLTGEVARMQVLTVVLVVIFGGMTILFNDEKFFKMKPTLVYLLFGGALSIGLLQGKSYLNSVMGQMVDMAHEGWMILTRRITVFFFALAILNEAIWRTQTTEVWVYFKTFGLTLAMFMFLASQYKVLTQYGNFEEK